MVHSINVPRISGVSRMYWRRCLFRRTLPLMRFPREAEFLERFGHVCFFFTLKQPNLFCVFLSYLSYYWKNELPNWISSVWYWSTEEYATRDYTQCEDCVLEHFTLYRTCKSLVQLYELDNIETPPKSNNWSFSSSTRGFASLHCPPRCDKLSFCLFNPFIPPRHLILSPGSYGDTVAWGSCFRT